jgi:hypothetical protein
MKLAIADPPYLGRAVMFYGEQDAHGMNVGGNINPVRKADRHPDAAVWDDPFAHKQMVHELMRDYEGWAIAMVPDSLRHYLQWVPERTRIAVWHNPRTMPAGQHPRRRWEPVLVYVPEGRRRIIDVKGPHVGDVLSAPNISGNVDTFAGAKPEAWTRWVLDMLGYDDEQDTVTDLFAGSGAVQRVIDTPTLTMEWNAQEPVIF